MSILWCLPSPSAPRSARRRVARALQTQPGQQWQRTAGSLRRTRSQGRHRGARISARISARKASPRSALRASLERPLRSSAIRTSPRLGSAVIPYGDVVAIDARQLECLLCVDVFPPTHRDVSLV